MKFSKSVLECRGEGVANPSRIFRGAPMLRRREGRAIRFSLDPRKGVFGAGDEAPEEARWQRPWRVSTERETEMKQWKRPVIVEIQVGMEINLYVCAEL
jgi:coenzyme PQQ precursor peptide PqqA